MIKTSSFIITASPPLLIQLYCHHLFPLYFEDHRSWQLIIKQRKLTVPVKYNVDGMQSGQPRRIQRGRQQIHNLPPLTLAGHWEAGEVRGRVSSIRIVSKPRCAESNGRMVEVASPHLRIIFLLCYKSTSDMNAFHSLIGFVITCCLWVSVMNAVSW